VRILLLPSIIKDAGAEWAYSVLNFRFDMVVVFIDNYFLVGVDIFIDNEMFLVIDFVNLKIKSTQSFRCAHTDRICIRVFIVVSLLTI
jgi:hypothetical protein